MEGWEWYLEVHGERWAGDASDKSDEREREFHSQVWGVVEVDPNGAFIADLVRRETIGSRRV